MDSLKNTIVGLIFWNFFASLKNDNTGWSQRKICVAGFVTVVIVGSFAYIANCLYRDKFDGTFIMWLTTMIGFIATTLTALYGTKDKSSSTNQNQG